VVVFSHGLLSQPADYTALLSGWARAGFVVAAPLYPHTSLGAAGYNAYDIVNQPADASAVLDQVLALNFQAGPLRGRLDPTRLAAAGHSAGGITTAGLFSAHRDTRLKAGIVLAGTDFLGTPFSGPPAALLFVQGRLDRTVTHRAATTVFNAVPWSRAMLTVTAGDHQTTDAELPAVGGTGAAFLHWSLYGGLPALAGPAALGGVATLDDQLNPDQLKPDQLNPERTAATSAGSTSYGA
jgi:dienelactone hydrolase